MSSRPRLHSLLGRRALFGVAVLAVVVSMLVVISPWGRPMPPAAVGAGGDVVRTDDGAPLTGEPLADRSVLERPIVGAKVENSAASRPQSGLDEADIVVEEIVEGGITRFLALFHSRIPETIGPVRSARPEDAAVLPAFDAMLFLSGARDEVLAGLTQAGVVWGSDDDEFPVFHRDTSRESPHNLYTTGPQLFDAAAGRVGAARPLPWPFADAPPAGATGCQDPCATPPGGRIDVVMSDRSRTGFVYDDGAGVYRRLQDGAPQRVTGAGEVGAANVIVLAMGSHDGGCCDTSGARYRETEVVGEGRMVLLRDGRRYDGRWEKPAASEQFRFSGSDGRQLVLRPGPTWILMAPATALR